MPDAQRTALITGASAGIGRAFAIELAKDGYDLVLTARRLERLEELRDELEEAHGVTCHAVQADLADPAAPERLVERTRELGVTVDFVVNNAGFGVPGYFVRTKWADQQVFLQVMLTAVAHLTHLVLPGMVERGFGRIVNVASLAGLVPGSAGHTLYGATKSFLVKFSESLTLELGGSGVHACAVCPGFTYSEFHDVVGNRGQVSKLPGFMWMDAETVARQGIDAVERGDAVYVNGLVNRTIATVVKHAPSKLALKVMGRQSRKIRTES